MYFFFSSGYALRSGPFGGLPGIRAASRSIGKGKWRSDVDSRDNVRCCSTIVPATCGNKSSYRKVNSSDAWGDPCWIDGFAFSIAVCMDAGSGEIHGAFGCNPRSTRRVSKSCWHWTSFTSSPMFLWPHLCFFMLCSDAASESQSCCASPSLTAQKTNHETQAKRAGQRVSFWYQAILCYFDVECCPFKWGFADLGLLQQPILRTLDGCWRYRHPWCGHLVTCLSTQ